MTKDYLEYSYEGEKVDPDAYKPKNTLTWEDLLRISNYLRENCMSIEELNEQLLSKCQQ